MTSLTPIHSTFQHSCRYKVGFTKEGKILALDVHLFNNGGNSLDLSLPVLERAIYHSENCYQIPNIRVHGWVCYSNKPTNTAFRGFGGPQGMLVVESWIDRVAREVGKSATEIQVRALGFGGFSALRGVCSWGLVFGFEAFRVLGDCHRLRAMP